MEATTAGGAQHEGDRVAYGLLGPLVAGRPGPLDLGPPKQRAVLALLALHRGRGVSAERLIEVLWDGDPPPSALASLQAYVSNLRRVLRDAAGRSSPIVRRAAGYVLDVAPEALDVTAFAEDVRRAREAAEAHDWPAALASSEQGLARWRGDALEDLRDQPWVDAEVAGLDELRAEARELRISALLAQTRVAPALVAARELRAAQPLRDRACWLLVVALHRAGRDSEALEEHRAYAERLDAELGLEPGPELRELQVAVLRHDPALAAWPRPAGWTGATRLQTPPATEEDVAGDDEPAPAAPPAGDADALVGREREQRRLDELLAEATSGTARWLAVTGPAGIGKTRLAEELARRGVAAGGGQAWARCSEEDGAPAWWPIRQLVRALGEDPDALLAAPTDVDADEGRFALYERVATLLQRTARARSPLVVVVDDVQWADRTSARCLAHLVGALSDVGVVVALTLREGEDVSPVAPLLAALARSDGHRQLALGPLAPGPAARLAELAAAGDLDPEQAEALAARTGGNPLFLREYARLPAADRVGGDAPLAVRSVLGRRLAGLDSDVIAVLRAAAVIGEVIDIPTLAATTRTQPDDLADLLDEAADEHVVAPRAGSTGYAFAHGLLREEVLAAMPALRRARLHLRVADALRDAAEDDDVPRRAGHLVAAGDLAELEEVVEACRAAARVAEARWSSEGAASWWAEALRAFDRLPAATGDPAGREAIVVAQVSALARAGRGQTVLDVVDAALLEAVRAGSQGTIGRLAASLLRSAGAWPWTAYGADPGPMVARLAGLEASVADDPGAHARLLAALAVGRCYDPDPAVPEALSRRSLDLAERLGDPEVLADALLGRLSTYSGVASHAREAVALSGRLAGLGHAEERVDAAIGLAIASMAHTALGDVPAAARDVRAAIAAADALRLPVVRAQLRWMEATLALWCGELDAATAEGEAAQRVHAQTELYFAGPGLNPLFAGSLARERGTLPVVDLGSAPEAGPWQAAVAAAREDRGAVEAAAGPWLDALGPWTWTTLPHVVLVGEALADVGAAGRAGQVLALLEPHAGAMAFIGHVGVVGSVDLVRGRLQALAGDPGAARATLEDALAAAEASGGAPTAARCRTALAALR